MTNESEMMEMLQLIRDGIPIKKWNPHRRHQFLRLFGGCLEEYNKEKEAGFKPNPIPDIETIKEEARGWSQFFDELAKSNNPLLLMEQWQEDQEFEQARKLKRIK